MLAGRPHEAVSNGSPRWMAAGPRERVHRTRPTGQLARRPTWEYAASPDHAEVAVMTPSSTFAKAWGAYYTFRYLGGPDRGAMFTIESYGAWHGKPLNMRLA